MSAVAARSVNPSRLPPDPLFCVYEWGQRSTEALLVAREPYPFAINAAKLSA